MITTAIWLFYFGATMAFAPDKEYPAAAGFGVGCLLIAAVIATVEVN